MTKRRLGELLRAEGLVTEDQVKLALVEQRKSNLFLGEALVKLGFVTEDAIASTISQQFGLPYISIEQYNIGKNIFDLFPESILREYQFLPIDKIGNVLVIVGSGLMNHDVLDELERLSGCRVCQYVGTWKDIYESIQKNFKDRKKEEGKPADELSSLGNLLLNNEVAAPAAAKAPTAGKAAAAKAPAEEANDMAAAVNAVTGSSSSVLEEALAAVEGSLKAPVKPAPVKAPVVQQAAPAAGAPTGSSSARLPSTGASGRISAFAGGKPPAGASGLKKSIPGSPAGGTAATPDEKQESAKKPGESGTAAAPGVPKGGLLGFLKK
ncbi:MAG: hypothetical protein HY291_23520 [Planctomycetes bacterium]|nr:hypothetical protein [Planctomycetota bacterium]